MTSYTRAQIRANREKWVAFLQEPERKKAKGVLARNGEHRCCLGHACKVLDPDQKTGWRLDDPLPPVEIQKMLGLNERSGMAYEGKLTPGFTELTLINDRSKTRPQEIGKMLEGMIEGGPNTPFFPLTNYPE